MNSVIDCLEALQAHYPRHYKTADEQRNAMRDYASDLGSAPLEVVERACTRWRQSDATRFPTPGQLMKLVDEAMPRDVGSVALWGPISDEAYDRLPLRDKIYHQTCLATDCDRKAGPMWRAGAPVALEDMPPAFHAMKQRAANHRAEAARLRELLARSKEA